MTQDDKSTNQNQEKEKPEKKAEDTSNAKLLLQNKDDVKDVKSTILNFSESSKKKEENKETPKEEAKNED